MTRSLKELKENNAARRANARAAVSRDGKTWSVRIGRETQTGFRTQREAMLAHTVFHSKA